MRTNKMFAGLFLLLAYPLSYYGWVKSVKDTWLDNDILDYYPDMLRPEVGRFSYRDPTRQFEEATIFSEKEVESHKQQ